MTRVNRGAGLALIASAILVAAAGCGFIAAGQKSVVKPATFTLFGSADVALPVSDHRAAGVSCTAPVPGIAPGSTVTVLDDQGISIAQGNLGPGVIGHAGATPSCNFPFTIAGVPGYSDVYNVKVAGEPEQPFPAGEVQRNAPAVVTITPPA